MQSFLGEGAEDARGLYSRDDKITKNEISAKKRIEESSGPLSMKGRLISRYERSLFDSLN